MLRSGTSALTGMPAIPESTWTDRESDRAMAQGATGSSLAPGTSLSPPLSKSMPLTASALSAFRLPSAVFTSTTALAFNWAKAVCTDGSRSFWGAQPDPEVDHVRRPLRRVGDANPGRRRHSDATGETYPGDSCGQGSSRRRPGNPGRRAQARLRRDAESSNFGYRLSSVA